MRCRVSLEATIRIGDRVLCDEGEAKALIRAILIDSAAGVLDRIVIEPPHMVAQGQFASAEQLSYSDGVLAFDGQRAIFDMKMQAETQQWIPSKNRGVGVIRGTVVSVDGLTTLEGSTPVLDDSGEEIGTVVGVAVRGGTAIESFVIRIPGRLRDKDVLVARKGEVLDLGAEMRLGITYEDLRRRSRV
jgi:hypothetical protein